jgi:predicted RNA-binding Zn-ribbon protein involved in translation (DUF1610 family)
VDKTIELVPLVCVRCNTPIPAEVDEVAWVCAQCGQGLLLEENGLQALEVNYLAGLPPNAKGKPYWVAQGQVSSLQREKYGSGNQETQQAEAYWSQARSFFVPAYSATLEDLLARATQLMLQPPVLQAGAAAPFEPVTLAAEDVRPAAEFIVVAIEAGRKDKLKKVNFSLQLSSPVLWILP